MKDRETVSGAEVRRIVTWLKRERTREDKFASAMVEKRNSLSAEKSSGISIGYGWAISKLEKLLRQERQP